MSELEYIALRAFYLLVGSVTVVAENTEKFIKEFPEEIQRFAEEVIVKGEETFDRWQEKKSSDFINYEEIPSPELQQRLFTLVRGDWALAERLLDRARQQYPDRPEYWYWEKVVNDLEQDSQ